MNVERLKAFGQRLVFRMHLRKLLGFCGFFRSGVGAAAGGRDYCLTNGIRMSTPALESRLYQTSLCQKSSAAGLRRRAKMVQAVSCALVACVILILNGCYVQKERRPYTAKVEGNPVRGKELIRAYGCGACHFIPGVRDARGLVGPPLLFFSQRTMLAGQLPNSPENLTRWIEHPRAIEPKTAMPDLGLTEDQAGDIAAYLYTLRGPEGT